MKIKFDPETIRAQAAALAARDEAGTAKPPIGKKEFLNSLTASEANEGMYVNKERIDSLLEYVRKPFRGNTEVEISKLSESLFLIFKEFLRIKMEKSGKGTDGTKHAVFIQIFYFLKKAEEYDVAQMLITEIEKDDSFRGTDSRKSLKAGFMKGLEDKLVKYIKKLEDDAISQNTRPAKKGPIATKYSVFIKKSKGLKD